MRQQHKMRNFLNVFQKISIEVVIITFSISYARLRFRFGFFFYEDYILGGGFACRVCDRLRASKLSKDPCSHRDGGPWGRLELGSPSEACRKQLGGRGMGDTQVTELGFCNLFPTACAYESSTSTLPHNPPVT